MGIAVIFGLWAVYLIFQDRSDWFKYAVLFVAAATFFSTPTGQDVSGLIADATGWADDALASLWRQITQSPQA